MQEFTQNEYLLDIYIIYECLYVCAIYICIYTCIYAAIASHLHMYMLNM